jgi:ubiquitin C-terminal hydrolase
VFQIARNNRQADATKQILVETLPHVLVLHLKRFVYADGQVQKLHKHIEYTPRLAIRPDLFSPSQHPPKPVMYQLFAGTFLSVPGVDVSGVSSWKIGVGWALHE